MPSEMPPPKRMQLEGEKKSAAEAINFLKTQCDERVAHKPQDAQDTQEAVIVEGPTVADELNARLAMVHVRESRPKRIRRLVKYPPHELQTLYR